MNLAVKIYPYQERILLNWCLAGCAGGLTEAGADALAYGIAEMEIQLKNIRPTMLNDQPKADAGVRDEE